MWTPQQLETYTEARIKAEHPDGETLWAHYVATRNNLVSSIFPHIAAREPSLTDHGVDHIANVISNVGKILGCQPIASSDTPRPAMPTMSSKELLLLLMGCLLHDIGNIVGRQGHNDSGMEVWRNSGNSYGLWAPTDRRTVVAVCRAHTGTSSTGSTDTLEHLSVGQYYFAGESIRAAEMAAVIRFSDELAEGRQRTSQYLLSQGIYNASSLPYHQYASSTDVVIDLPRGRVALTYDIDLSAKLFLPVEAIKDHLRNFLKLIYGRILKMEHERVFARHYAPGFIRFRETSVALHFNKSDIPIVIGLQPLLLNDFNARGQDLSIIPALNAAYDTDTIINAVIPGDAVNG